MARWMRMLVAVCATIVALFAANACWHTARLPYNGEGRSFDTEASVVTTDGERQFWAMLACASLALGAGLAFVGWKLQRR